MCRKQILLTKSIYGEPSSLIWGDGKAYQYLMHYTLAAAAIPKQYAPGALIANSHDYRRTCEGKHLSSS